MANIQYIGARYVPKFYENPDDGSNNWKAGVSYEPLIVVTDSGDSYTSKIPVPGSVGAPSLNPTYWVKTGDYNAAYHALQDEINSIKNGGLNDNVLEYSKFSRPLKRIIEKNWDVIFVKHSGHDNDTNNGSCIIFISRIEKKVIMFDCERAENYDDVKNALISKDIHHIDYFILTHYHRDHFGCLPYLFNDGYMNGTTVAYLPREASISGWNDKRAEVIAYFNTVITLDPAAPLLCDGFTFNFLNCSAEDYAYYDSQGVTNTNTYSMVSYMTCNNFTLMLCGDMSSEAFTRLKSQNKIKHCNVLNAPHHGISTGSDIYLRTTPDCSIANCGIAPEYDPANLTTNRYYVYSSDVAEANALNIPVYITGYDNIYLGISDQEYSVISNGKKVRSYVINDVTLNLYVDQSYRGDTLGTHDKPFNSVLEALAYASFINVALLQINIIGSYGDGNEVWEISNMKQLKIVGTMSDSQYNVNIARATVNNSCLVNFDTISFNATTTAEPIYANNSYVIAANCKISGDSTAATGVNGAALRAFNNAVIYATNCEISNRHGIIRLDRMSSGYIYNCTGSANSFLFFSDAAGALYVYDGDISWDVLGNYNGNRGIMKVITDRNTNFSSDASVVFSDRTNVEKISQFKLNSAIYNGRDYLVFGGDGSIHHFKKNGNNNFSNIDTVLAATHSSDDPNFALSIANNILSITFATSVRIEMI